VSTDPWSHLIVTETISEIHSECIARFGGDPTPNAEEGCVERSIGAAWNAELYLENSDAKPGLCFAGCLLFYLIKNHCFVDGNKRVGWAVCMEVLRSLGLTVKATDQEVEKYCVAIIEGSEVKTALDVSSWLALRLEAL
jgi:death on curing protein